jgi:hypothetical protein
LIGLIIDVPSGIEADGGSETIRSRITRIVLTPEGDQLTIKLEGHLAGMLTLAENNKRPSKDDDLLEQIQLVAGAGFET